ncbi:MAG: DEAD/DEAH box helicase [Spirochaetaceae bacterium]|nr:DEAD/DEAH box helicase [Spirochaetaceae bacterium]
MERFEKLGLERSLTEAFARLGYTEPTLIQKRAIPFLLEARDLIMESETGTGKTFAYLAPVFHMIARNEPRMRQRLWPSAIVICPTQELAVQVARQAKRLADAAGMPLSIATMLGGTHYSRQKEELKAHPHLVTGTPGRLADLVRLGFLPVNSLIFLVLDEADRLFSNEYEEAVQFLLSKIPSECVRVLASATIPGKTRQRALPFLRNPVTLDMVAEGVLSSAIEHWVLYADHRRKIDQLIKLDSAVHPGRCLVFASDTYRVEKAASRLAAAGIPAGYILSRMPKEDRHTALERFARGSLRYLVTTDLAARGLDIPDITHIVSLDMPDEPAAYIHRAGRTGRAGRKGISILLADGVELRRASRTAVGYGFVFRTKWLSEGMVLEPDVETFFSRVEEMERERHEKRNRPQRP